MASVYEHHGKWWARLRDGAGKWVSRATPFAVTEERRKAQSFADETQRIIDESREAGETGPLTVARYAERWSAEREARGVAAAQTDLARMRKYALPVVGALQLTEVRPKHARDLVHALRAADQLAPRTIIHIYRDLRSMFESAIVDEIVVANPIKLKKGDLPKKRDKDPTWRSQATFTVHEVERLISDCAIPVERRVQYALKAIAGMRHGEVAALTWRAIDETAEPLARINITQAFDSKRRRIKRTKTEDTRAVPMHPTLARIIAAWKQSHWERIYGRPSTLDDFVVPARTMAPVNATDAVHAFVEDLTALGLRIEAGEHRRRGGHDLRSWYKTQTIDDGADSLIIRRTTHSVPDDVNAGYERFPWSTKCREVNKLRVAVLGGEVLQLATTFATKELNARNRWVNIATPTGFEPVLPA